MHPNIYKFVETLLHEQATAEANAEFVIASQLRPKKKKVYLDMVARIKRLVNNFSVDAEEITASDDDKDDDENDDFSNPMLRYLQGLAHNISYS